MWLTRPQPFHAMYPLVRIPNIHPRFVHCDDIAENPWILMVESGKKVANVLSPPLVCLGQECRHKGGTTFFELQILVQDPLDCCCCHACSHSKLLDCDAPVLGNKGLHPPYVPRAPSRFGFWSPFLVNNALAPSSELSDPKSDGTVRQSLGEHSLECSLNLVKRPPHFHTEMYVNPVLELPRDLIDMFHLASRNARKRLSG